MFNASSIGLVSVTCLLVSYLFYKYVTSTFTYFSDQGIPGPKPWPIVGNMWGLWKTNLPQHDVELVNKYGKVFGYFEGPNPVLWVADSDLIRSIFIKDFDHFVDRRIFDVKTKGVRMWLTQLHGQQWKDVRSSLTPAFTTGKIKRMCVLIKECVDKMAERLTLIAENGGRLEAKDAFTMDVIARCAFGLTIETLGEKDDPFINHARHVFHAEVCKSPLILLPNMYPKVFSVLLDRMFVTKHLRFFLDLLDGIIHERSQSSQKFNDFIDAATEAISDIKKEGTNESMWTREDVTELLVAQSSLFMIAGFDTTAMTMTNASYLLAKNPDVQEKLYDAVIRRMEDFDEVNYDMVADIPYLDQVIHEVLRIYPPAIRVDRTCLKDISYGNIRIKKGMIINVPVYALHHLEEHYPEPEKFYPERWSADNKAKRNPYVFMPFGVGPRNCIGMRFALEEMKIAFASLVTQFRFYTVPETPDKLVFEDGLQFVLQPTHAIVGIERRDQDC